MRELILVVMLAVTMSACAVERTPAVDDDNSTVQVDCNIDRFNVRCPNPFGGAR